MKRLLSVVILIVLFTLNSFATDYYVSKSGNDSWNGLYPTFEGGSDGPWLTIREANSTLIAGDTVYVRTGIYTDADNGAVIFPDNSGSSGNLITFTNYQSEVVNCKGQWAGAKIYSVDYIKILNINFINADQTETMQVGVDMRNANYCIVENCEIKYMFFSGGGSYNKGIKQDTDCSYCQILDNNIQYVGRFYDPAWSNPGEGIWVSGDHHIVDGNFTDYCGHSGIGAATADQTVIKNNVCWGNWGRCGWMGNNNSAHRLIVEDNVYWKATRYTGYGAPYQGFQHESSYGTIFRRNIIYDGWGTGFKISGSATEDSVDLRMYQNVVYNNGTEAVADYDHGLNVIENDSDGHILTCEYKNNIFYNNNSDGPNYMYFADPADHTFFATHWNSDGDPKFSNPGGGGFTLNPDSPCIDNGTWLTLTNGADTGTTMVVDDASYFTDGYGLQAGDIIQLDGQTVVAEVTGINYGTDTLTLGTPLTWNNNQGVALAYNGAAPDQGAYESEIIGNKGHILPGAKFIILPGGKIIIKEPRKWRY